MRCDELESNLTICFHLKDQEDVKLLMRAIDETYQAQSNENLVEYSWSGKAKISEIYHT
jgi:hypothetical protein